MSDGSVVLALSQIKPGHTFSPKLYSCKMVVINVHLRILLSRHSTAPLNRITPEKPTGPQLVKEFSAFYGTT